MLLLGSLSGGSAILHPDPRIVYISDFTLNDPDIIEIMVVLVDLKPDATLALMHQPPPNNDCLPSDRG
jgi:hypothetical protein